MPSSSSTATTAKLAGTERMWSRTLGARSSSRRTAVAGKRTGGDGQAMRRQTKLSISRPAYPARNRFVSPATSPDRIRSEHSNPLGRETFR